MSTGGQPHPPGKLCQLQPGSSVISKVTHASGLEASQQSPCLTTEGETPQGVRCSCQINLKTRDI